MLKLTKKSYLSWTDGRTDPNYRKASLLKIKYEYFSFSIESGEGVTIFLDAYKQKCGLAYSKNNLERFPTHFSIESHKTSICNTLCHSFTRLRCQHIHTKKSTATQRLLVVLSYVLGNGN